MGWTAPITNKNVFFSTGPGAVYVGLKHLVTRSKSRYISQSHGSRGGV